MNLIILDRDGVINFDSDHFIKNPEEWKPIPGSLEAIARLCQADYRVMIATNQSGIGRGLFDMHMLYCPHAADAGCHCRKPKTGMFEDIATRYNANLKGVPAVGDSLRDLTSAAKMGAQPILVLTGKGKKTQAEGGLPEGTLIYPDLAAAVATLA